MQFSVLQWNVWFEENIEHILSFLQNNPADIICLQELTRGYLKQTQENTWEYLANQLGYNLHVKEIPVITPEAQWAQGNAILSKHPIVDTSWVWVHEPISPEALNDQYRVYIDITLNMQDEQVVIGTTHLLYAPSFADTPAKRHETAKLCDILASKTGKFIFTGDLNALPDSQCIQSILRIMQHAGPGFDEKTWTTKPFSYPDFEATTLDWRMDYIFYKNMQPCEAHIIPTDYSDHLPIRATFTIL